MATNEKAFDDSGSIMGGPASLLARDSQAPSRPVGPSTLGRDDAPGASRRPSTTSRRAAYNAQHFADNRHGHEAALSGSHRVRTRSVARIEAQERQRHTQPTEHAESRPAVAVQTSSSDKACEAWKPSIVIGSPLWLEGEDLSAIQIADRRVAQTRLWADYYRGVPYFEQAHRDAVEQRQKLDETSEENTKPISTLESTWNRAIQDRLDVLGTILQSSSFPPERENIEAAMAGYRTGAIPYSDSYTILWAGRIVDHCPDYPSFTRDREARITRYAAEYGPGWLWYEPPLMQGQANVVAKRGFCLESKASWRQPTENMGHYRIQMGFRRRKTNRLTSPVRTSQARTIPQPSTSAPGRTAPDPDGPRIIFSVLLDSGATFPTLWESDLPALGIDPDRYAAQSARRVHTADSTLVSRIYELDVSVLGGIDDDDDNNNDNSRSTSHGPLPRTGSRAKAGTHPDPTNPSGDSSSTTAARTTALSCTIPVLVFPGASREANTTAQADGVPDRLSGLLPFHMCYLSGAPGSFRLWMGDRRRDVLGAARLPGAMRYGEVLGAAGDYHDHDHHHDQNQNHQQQTQSQGEEEEEEEEKKKDKLARLLSRCRGTPERVIFEHELGPDPDPGSGSGSGFDGGASADIRGKGGGVVLVLRDEDVDDDFGNRSPFLLLLSRPRRPDDDDEGRKTNANTHIAGSQGTDVHRVRSGGRSEGEEEEEEEKKKKKRKKKTEKNGQQPALGRDVSRGRAIPLRRRASVAMEEEHDGGDDCSCKPARKRVRL
ncbi:hypothetical protein VTH06DRAFT_620 [Thermothelomyces fergusii]